MTMVVAEHARREVAGRWQALALLAGGGCAGASFLVARVPGLFEVALALLFALTAHATAAQAARGALLWGIGLAVVGFSPGPLAAWNVSESLLVTGSVLGALVVIGSVPVALAAALAARLTPQRPILRFWLAWPAAYLGAEGLRVHALGDLSAPYLLAGLTHVPDGALVGLAPGFGMAGVGLAVASASGALAAIAVALGSAARGLRRVGYTAAGAAAHLAVLVGGAHAVHGWAVGAAQVQDEGDPIAAVLVQQTAPRQTPDDAAEAVEAYDRWRRAIAPDARLLVLPESAMGLVLDTQRLEALRAEWRGRGVDVITGASLAAGPAGAINAALLIDEQGVGFYGKSRRFPLGEFIPPIFSALLGDMQPLVADIVPTPEFDPVYWAGRPLTVMICVEEAFSSLLVAQAMDTPFIVVLSNLGPFANVGGEEQVVRSVQARALESSRTVVRVDQRAATVVVRPDGSLDGRLGVDQQRAVAVVIQPRLGLTPFLRHGEMPIYLLCAAMLCAIGMGVYAASREPAVPGE
jgi:apolipoprotein N-acyltransferase